MPKKMAGLHVAAVISGQSHGVRTPTIRGTSLLAALRDNTLHMAGNKIMFGKILAESHAVT
jgi:hypothetical protein